jgi:protein TonB
MTQAMPVPDPVFRKARPLYRQNPPPHYPRTARRRGHEGIVVLEVKVLKDGTVGDLRVHASSGHAVLDQAAVKSVRKWLFEPGLQGDQKVDMWVRVPIRFEIE